MDAVRANQTISHQERTANRKQLFLYRSVLKGKDRFLSKKRIRLHFYLVCL